MKSLSNNDVSSHPSLNARNCITGVASLDQERCLDHMIARLESCDEGMRSENEYFSSDFESTFNDIYRVNNHGVKLILDRMSTNPEEFKRPNVSMKGKWDWLLQSISSEFERARGGNKVEVEQNISFLTSLEIEAIYLKFLLLERKAFAAKIENIISRGERFNESWKPPEIDPIIDRMNLPLVIENYSEALSGSSLVERIRGTWLGRFYVNHLKKVPIVRRLVILSWRNGFPLYVRYISGLFSLSSARWLPLIKMADYVKASNLPVVTIFDSSRVDTPKPNVYPSEDCNYLLSPHDYYVFPSVYVAKIESATIYAGTNLVFTKVGAICHDLYDFERDFTSEELHGRHVINVKNNQLKIVRYVSSPDHIPIGAVFLDACAGNYAHWLTEVLPRITAFCSLEQFKHIPLIVDDGLHKNLMESLHLVAGSERRIITVPIGRAFIVDELFVTSPAGYVPFERRNGKLRGHSHGTFNPLALEFMKTRLMSFVENYPNKDWPKKIYLRRKSGARSIVNADEIQDSLLTQGYVVVDPENLSFIHQLVLFGSVDLIAGPSGAAFANLIFSHKESKVLIFIGKFEGTSYWYWQNLAAATGKSVNYILGKIDNTSDGIHSNFSVSKDQVEEFYRSCTSHD